MVSLNALQLAKIVILTYNLISLLTKRTKAIGKL